jgi:hypothetical protein
MGKVSAFYQALGGVTALLVGSAQYRYVMVPTLDSAYDLIPLDLNEGDTFAADCGEVIDQAESIVLSASIEWERAKRQLDIGLELLGETLNHPIHRPEVG